MSSSSGNLAPFLSPFIGDSGAGGHIGLVPAPAAGDAAAGKFLSADGGWAVPADASGVTSVQGTSAQIFVNATAGTPQTGALTLTLPQSIATNSNVVFGQLGLGISPAGALHSNGTGATAWSYFTGNTASNLPSATYNYGLMIGYNNSSFGETTIAWGTGVGSVPILNFSAWDGTSISTKVVITASACLGIDTVDFGSGSRCLGFSNTSSPPTTTPGAGGVIYVQAGALKYKGGSGTVTTLANA